jgi:predicted RNase H-like HicB family nuclease
MACMGATVSSIDESLRFTIVYEDGGEGWIMARVVEVPGAMSQGRSREEGHANVLDALRLMLSPEPDEAPAEDRDSVPLTIDA